MKKIIKISFLLLAMVCMAAALQAQSKFGYVHSAAILAQMPDVKQADANLADLQKVLQKQYEDKIASFQTKYQTIAEKEQKGEYSPKQIEEEAAKLKKEEEAIAKFEQTTQKQLMDKREELLKPIYERVNTAIKDVAKEGGYQMIFDASTSILLYAEEGADVSDLVKVKLGIKS